MKKSQTGLLLLLAVIWGSYYVITQQALQYLPTFAMGFTLRAITAVILTAVILLRRQFKTLRQPRRTTCKLLLVGVFGFLLDATAFWGLQLAPAGIGSVLLKCDILFVNLISVFVYRCHFSKRVWLYTAVMLTGVVLILRVDWRAVDLLNSGNLFFILSALFVTFNAFLIKNIQNEPHTAVGNHVIAYYNNFVTMTLFLVASCLSGQLGALLGPFGTLEQWTVVGLGAVAQAVIYFLYYHNLRNLPVWVVKSVLLLMPLVTTLLSAALFRERPSSWQLLGMAVLLIGAFGILREQRVLQEEAAALEIKEDLCER